MNQILNIDFKKNIDANPSTDNCIQPSSTIVQKNFIRKSFNIQFIISIIAIIIFSSCYIIYKYNLSKVEHLSDKLISNYNLSKLYSNYTSSNESTSNYQNPIIGIIEIPIINIYYPIFNDLNDNLLKVSPCKFYGEMPLDLNSTGNLCIAAHNYDNQYFFSNISKLSPNDKIFIYNNNGIKFCYYVFQNYEVEYNDISPIYPTSSDSLELTLITCNNFNNNRIIVKAKAEGS